MKKQQKQPQRNITEKQLPHFSIPDEAFIKILPNTEENILKNGFSALFLSLGCYFSKQRIEKWYRRFPNHNVACFNYNNHAWMASYSDDTLVLAFRGTDDLNDVLKCVQWHKDTFYNTRIQAAGASFLNNVRPQIIKILEKYGKRRKLVLTGHSLGGALAAYVAMMLDKEGVDIDGVYTFGCPRLGGVSFRDQYKKRLWDITYRFVVQHDLVTRVPTKLLMYHHVGQLIQFKQSGKVICDEKKDSIWIDIIEYFAQLFAFGIKTYTPIEYHMLKNYCLCFMQQKEIQEMLRQYKLDGKEIRVNFTDNEQAV